MHLDRPLGNAERTGDLLVRIARREQVEHFPLARGQIRLMELSHLHCLESGAAHRQGRDEGLPRCGCLHRLLELLRRAALGDEAAASCRQRFQDHIPAAAISRDQDRQGRPGRAQPMKTVRPGHSREVELNHCQADAGPILAQYAGKLREVSAAQHR